MKIYLSRPGLICAAGKDAASVFKNVCKADNSFIQKRSLSSGQDFFAASVQKEDLDATGGRYDSKLLRMENYALNQISSTIEKALSKYGSDRVGACVGTCDNLTELSSPAHLAFFTDGDFKDYSIEKQSAHYAATFIKERFGLKAPCSAFSTACSSSAVAIIKGAQLIKAGICDAVIAGGLDIASDTALMGFGSLEAISPEATNPFSKNRHGITLGEAAAFFVLAREDLAKTEIILAGYGESADAYHMTSPDPEGKGAASAMEEALKSAGLTPAEIDYLNLHGTGTKFNDSMEAKAVDKIFGEYKVPCSSTKGTTGHTLGAAAALELAICFETLKSGSLPAQRWDGIRDEEMPELNFVSKNAGAEGVSDCAGGSAGRRPPSICMSNSFAFGGANAALIIKKE